MAGSNGWRNRIVEYGTKRADQFTAHPNNWRKHPKHQREALAASLNSVGWVGVVLENRRTGHLLDGHERLWQALAQGDDTPVPYITVDVSEDEEHLILATLDPITAMAQTDADILEGILADLRTSELVQEDEALEKLLREVAEQTGVERYNDEAYSRKIEAPTYEPSEVKPSISELYDDSKTQALIAAIEASSLSDEEKTFLKIAAQRHTVLNFAKIADYYAYADEELQTLMEDSALVIIDFDRAIELGFVQLTERIAEMVRDEYGE